MPEQNLEGYATVNSLAHYRFQKIPEDKNLSDDLAISPVTGIFAHESTDVWTLTFENGDTLGVTGSHPIYSLDTNGWVLASTLSAGNQVLTKSGYTTVTSVKKQSGRHKVYNLEVKDWHNFLVGDDGVVVHNGCIDDLHDLYKSFISKKALRHILRGDVKAGKAGGVHHISAMTAGTAKKVGSQIPGPNGLYKVKVKVKDVNGNWIPKTTNNGYSTFFPDNWDQIRVMDEIKHAVKVSFRNHVQGNEYWGYAKDGITKIYYYLKTDGTIISAFPKF